jgi:hypothetical protein
LETGHGRLSHDCFSRFARKLFRKIESVAAGGAAFDLAVACYLSNISRWHLSNLPRQADDVR